MKNEDSDITKEYFIDSQDTEKLKNYQYPTIPDAQYCPFCKKN